MVDDPPAAPDNFLVIAVVFEGMLGLVAVVLGGVFGHPPAHAIHWTVDAVLWGIAASLPLIVFLWICVRFPFWPFADLVRVVDDLVATIFRQASMLQLALISLVAGLGEEMLFRAVIQETLAGWIGGAAGPWIGLALASLLFGLVHGITFSYLVVATLMGAYLGWLWIISGNLLIPVAAHAVYDFLALVYFVKVRPRWPGGLDQRPGQS